MRWQGQTIDDADAAALPGLENRSGIVQSVTTPEFAGMTFHEVLARSALNAVPAVSRMPFRWTINPYRGCSHACVYCVDPRTLVLCADGRQRPIRDLRTGDEIIGTERQGRCRRYIRTRVQAKWTTRKTAYRVTLADGTELIASGDHRFLTDRGWKHVADAHDGQRPHLTVDNRLMGFGGGTPQSASAPDSADYRRGYPASEGVSTITRPFSLRSETRARMTGIPVFPSKDWRRGFLSGIFDAEGSCSRGVLRISNRDPVLLSTIMSALRAFDIPCTLEPPRVNGVRSVRVTGGLPSRMKFFAVASPAITRKPSIEGTAVKSVADLRVISIEELPGTRTLVDITTGTGDFVANGVISHNCFARGTHQYLDLDAGHDFDSQIVVKTNVVDVLRRELRRGSWQHETVALGTNTDPYQRAEGRYRLMPGIIAALADSGTPMSILTKGTLIRRDIPLLVEAAARVPVDIQLSIAMYDEALQRSIEPGTPSTQARLDTVRALTDAGFRVGVFLMPVLPYLTDSVDAIDSALRRIADAGAAHAVYGALHLRAGVKPWFFQWLQRERPDLVAAYRGLYPGAASEAPKGYRRWLAERIRPLIRAHGLRAQSEQEHDRMRGMLRARTNPAPLAAPAPATLF
ncbi:intein-containing Rv2578c family radical SAM protein [Microbacterium soli]|uniref:Intein-containing Rv2578c family radical SAM protein n=1 Tax=Microbacterium soli TaxID=446075 RepID=A0ABP7MZJ0_9MICO